MGELVKKTIKQKRAEVTGYAQNAAAMVDSEAIQNLTAMGVDIEGYKQRLHEAISNNNNLVGSKTSSLFAAIRECISNGLLPNGRDAVIYKNKYGECTYLSMVGGLKSRIYQATGRVIKTGVVREGDYYKISKGGGQDIVEHSPVFSSSDKERPVIGAWASLELENNGLLVHWMDKYEIMQVRKVSKNDEKDAPWILWFGAMAEKAVAKSLANRLYFIFESSSKALWSILNEDNEDNEIIDVELNENDEDVVTQGVGIGEDLDEITLAPPPKKEASAENVSAQPKKPIRKSKKEVKQTAASVKTEAVAKQTETIGIVPEVPAAPVAPAASPAKVIPDKSEENAEKVSKVFGEQIAEDDLLGDEYSESLQGDGDADLAGGSTVLL